MNKYLNKGGKNRKYHKIKGKKTKNIFKDNKIKYRKCNKSLKIYRQTKIIDQV